MRRRAAGTGGGGGGGSIIDKVLFPKLEALFPSCDDANADHDDGNNDDDDDDDNNNRTVDSRDPPKRSAPAVPPVATLDALVTLLRGETPSFGRLPKIQFQKVREKEKERGLMVIEEMSRCMYMYMIGFR